LNEQARTQGAGSETGDQRHSPDEASEARIVQGLEIEQPGADGARSDPGCHTLQDARHVQQGHAICGDEAGQADKLNHQRAHQHLSPPHVVRESPRRQKRYQSPSRVDRVDRGQADRGEVPLRRVDGIEGRWGACREQKQAQQGGQQPERDGPGEIRPLDLPPRTSREAVRVDHPPILGATSRPGKVIEER
jgi:hypothetical protein